MRFVLIFWKTNGPQPSRSEPLCFHFKLYYATLNLTVLRTQWWLINIKQIESSSIRLQRNGHCNTPTSRTSNKRWRTWPRWDLKRKRCGWHFRARDGTKKRLWIRYYPAENEDYIIFETCYELCLIKMSNFKSPVRNFADKFFHQVLEHLVRKVHDHLHLIVVSVVPFILCLLDLLN